MALYLFIGFFTLGFSYWLACLFFSRQDPELQFSSARSKPQYPPDFLYGTATSAHQIEGGNQNDWSLFEDAGKVARGEKSGAACDHWNKYNEDIALMKQANCNAYRFSIEWSRVQPTEDSWDEAAWEHYASELAQLREEQIIPMATLLHFTLPQWLVARGGVLAPDFVEKFAEFSAEAARRCWSMVEHWCTVNEPNVQMFMGYLQGHWPPAKKSPAEATQAFVALLKAHAAASREIRAVSPEAQIGVAMNLICFEPHSRGSLLDWISTRMVSNAYNWAFYDAIKKGRIQFRLPGQEPIDEPLDTLLHSADFIGVNYYTRYRIRFSPRAEGFVEWQPGPNPRSDLGWEIYPEGLLRLLREASRRYQLPLYITENGIADHRDSLRGGFIEDHIHSVALALQEGLPVQGYFHWSLLDNFEWAEGFEPRFGLYRVNYETLQRTATSSLDTFRRLSPIAEGEQQ
jgi:beta-glucosidase